MPTKQFLLYTIIGIILSAALGDRLNEENVRVIQCFDNYIPLLNGVILEFSHSYQECFAMDPSHYWEDRNQRIQEAEVDEEARAYSIERCQNATKRAFVENTATNYKGLHLCLEEIQSETTTIPGVPSTTGDDDEPVTPTPTPTEQNSSTASTEIDRDTSTIQVEVTTAKGRSSRLHISLILLFSTLLRLP